jgi:hypothetical protein
MSTPDAIQRIPSTGAPEHGYPHGHLHHLTEVQLKALNDFKVFLEEKGMYKPGPPASHDDQTLLYDLSAPLPTN